MSDEKVFKPVPPEQAKAAWDAIKASGLDASQFTMQVDMDWLAPNARPVITVTRGQKVRKFTSNFSDSWVGELRLMLASGEFKD